MSATQPLPKKKKNSNNKGWKRSRRLRWTAGIAAAALLGAGGALAGLKLTSSGAPASNAAAAVALNAALSPTSNCLLPGSGGNSGGSGKDCLRLQLHRVKGMYGEIAYHTSNGTETLAYERGTIVSAKAGVLVVKARNGTEWSWNVASSSIVRESGKPTSGSMLTSGAKVFVGGQITGNSKNARLIVIHKKNAGGSSGKKSSGSSSTSNSASGSAT